MADARVEWLREQVTGGLSTDVDMFENMLAADDGKANQDIVAFLDAERKDHAVVIYVISEAELFKATAAESKAGESAGKPNADPNEVSHTKKPLAVLLARGRANLQISSNFSYCSCSTDHDSPPVY